MRQTWVRAAPFVLLTIFAVLAATSVLEKSATYDESHYLGVGRYILMQRQFDIADSLLHPILWTIIHDLPLLAVDISDEVWKEPDSNIRGQKLIALRADDWILNMCRLAVLPFGLVLGWIVFLWSRELYGTSGGLLSLTLFCFCPNFLAHAPLVTPDVALACATVFALYRLWKLAREGSRSNLVLASIALGLMFLTKYTALLLVPILIVTDLACRMAAAAGHGWPSAERDTDVPSTRSAVRGFLKFAREWLIVLGGALLILWAAYLFDVGHITFPSGVHIPMFAPAYYEGVLYQWQESRSAHGLFLMGMYSDQGWWYYYIVTLLIKVPVGTLLLAVGLFLARHRLNFRFTADDIYLFAPFVMLFTYLSFFSTIHNGIRYLLPVIPLVFILIGKYGVTFAERPFVRWSVCLLATWVAFSCLWTRPHYIAYFNELIGGPREGYNWLGDSSLDWGQDLKGLKHYMDDHSIKRVRLSYFGTADPAHYGIDYEYLPSANSPLHIKHPVPGEPRPNIVALSAYQYQAVDFEDKNIYAFFYPREPNDMVGHSILIYDLNAMKPRKTLPLPVKIRALAARVTRRVRGVFD